MKIKDPDLAFLYVSDNSDIKDFVSYLLPSKSKDLGNMVTHITSELQHNKSFMECYDAGGDLHGFLGDIIKEFQLYGGDTFANTGRRLFGNKKRDSLEGVPYREILRDVCKQMKCEYDENKDLESIESLLMETVIRKILTDKNIKDNDIAEIAKSANVKVAGGKEVMIGALITAFRAGGFASYQMSVIVVNAISRAILGRGLTLAANAGLTRALGVFMGPVGWVLTAVMTGIDLAGVAYRITIPSVIQIAFMRQKFNQETYQSRRNG